MKLRLAVERIAITGLAVMALVGVIYWWTGPHDLMRFRVKPDGLPVYGSGAHTWSKIMLSSTQGRKNPATPALMAEKYFLSLVAAHVVVAAGIALSGTWRAGRQTAGRLISASFATWAAVLGWYLVSGQDPGRGQWLAHHPVSRAWLEIIQAVLFALTMLMFNEFFRRFPRPIPATEITETKDAIALDWTQRPLLSADRLVLVTALLCVALTAVGQLPARALAEFNLMVHLAGPFLVLISCALVVGAAGDRVRLSRSNCTVDEKRRTDWIYCGFWIGALLPLLGMLGAGVAVVTGYPDPMLIARAGMIGLAAGMIAVSVSFGLSVFGRGAYEPSLLIHKTTWIALIALCMSLLLAVIQHFVTVKVMSHSTASVQQGLSTVLAGGLVVFSLGFFRQRVERGIDGFLNRFMPATVIAEGTRREVTVAFSDLAGYTALSAKDEQQALHVAGHFQKAAAEVARRHDGRIVKTIGDAVMWIFATPAQAFAATLELPAAFQRATQADNLPDLPVNSGVHHGSVVEAPGGDVYGAAVNLAARLQGVAKDGAVVASMEAVQEVSGGFKLEPLGKLELKNVPVPVACFRVAPA